MSCLRPCMAGGSPNRFPGLARWATFRRPRGGLRTAEHLDSLWEDCEDRKWSPKTIQRHVDSMWTQSPEWLVKTELRPEMRPKRRGVTCLYEPLASRMAGYIVSFAIAAGFSTALWLLVFGVNERRWREQAKAARQ